jgi:predicted glutamine amidotransferase
MHNGVVPQFAKIKRALRNILPDDLYNQINGTTDSEHAFALFLYYLELQQTQPSIQELEDAMQQCIAKICELMRDARITASGFFNFAVTDGESVVVTRFTTDDSRQPESLYFAEGDRFAVEDEHYRMFPIVDRARAVIVASEPLTHDKRGWMMVPENHMVSITEELHIRINRIGAERHQATG